MCTLVRNMYRLGSHRCYQVCLFPALVHKAALWMHPWKGYNPPPPPRHPSTMESILVPIVTWERIALNLILKNQKTKDWTYDYCIVIFRVVWTCHLKKVQIMAFWASYICGIWTRAHNWITIWHKVGSYHWHHRNCLSEEGLGSWLRDKVKWKHTVEEKNTQSGPHGHSVRSKIG